MPPSPLRLAVIGATGTIGREIVAQALDAGHAVTALVRTPSKLEIEHPDLTVIEGSALSVDSVTEAVRGHDAVLLTMGGGLRGTTRSDGTRATIRAMQATGVRRLICQTTLGAGDSRANLNLWWKYVMFGLLLRGAYRDHHVQEDLVRASGLDWTIIRPAAFTDGERTGEYRHGFGPGATGLTLTISRKDVADFMLSQLGSDAYLHQAPGQSY